MKLTKRQITIAAKIYLKALIVNYDEFNSYNNTPELDGKIHEEILNIVNKLTKNIDCEAPMSSLECVEFASRL